MKDTFKKILKYLVSLAVAAVLLYFSFKGVEWEDFIDGLRSCRWGFVAASMAAGILAFWFRGLRWRQLLTPLDASLSPLTAFNAVNIGYIANFVFPRIGEFVRCGVISNRSLSNHRAEASDGAGAPRGASAAPAGPTTAASAGPAGASAPATAAAGGTASIATYDKVLGTVVMERAWDMVVLAAVTLGFLLLKWNVYGTFFVEEIWNPASQRVNFSLWWVVLAGLVLVSGMVWAVWVLRHRSRVCGKILEIVKGVLQGFTTAFRMEHKWKFIGNTLLIWTMYWLMAVFTMWSIPELSYLTLTDALFLTIAGSLGWVVPVPGGFGSFHFIVSLALSSVYGIPFSTGIVFATLSHESQAITMALCGALSYFYEVSRK